VTTAGLAVVGLLGELAVDTGTASGGKLLGALVPIAVGSFVAASPATAARIGSPSPWSWWPPCWSVGLAAGGGPACSRWPWPLAGWRR
jgi:hypothetical protein